MLFTLIFLPYNDTIQISRESMSRFPDSLPSTIFLDDENDNLTSLSVEVPGGGRFSTQIFNIYEYGSTTIPRDSKHFMKFYNWLQFLGLSMHPRAMTLGIEFVSDFCIKWINTIRDKPDIYYISEFPSSLLKNRDLVEFELARRGSNCSIEPVTRISTGEFQKYQSVFYVYNTLQIDYSLPDENIYTVTNIYESISCRKGGFTFTHNNETVSVIDTYLYWYLVKCKESYELCHTLFRMYSENENHNTKIGDTFSRRDIETCFPYKNNSVIMAYEMVDGEDSITDYNITIVALRSSKELSFGFKKSNKKTHDRYIHDEFSSRMTFESCVKITSY